MTTRDDLFAAHFIGSPSMNLIPAQMSDGALRVAGQEIALPAQMLEALAGAGEVTLGIRPHDVRPANGADWPSLSAEVVDVVTLGRERSVDFRLDGALYKGTAAPGETLAAEARLAFDPDRLLFFGPDGRRVRI